jgi:hypothetical protein
MLAYSMLTPKRLRHYFPTVEGAQKFALLLKEDGARDVTVVPKNFSDSHTPAADHGADVIWTDNTTD